ncbi:MAG: TolC family protein [Candidatus Zixiibacteriota bacterium]
MNLNRHRFWIFLFFVLPLSLFAQKDKAPIQIGYFEAGQYYTHKLVYREISDFLHENESELNREIQFNPYGYRTAEWDRDKCRAMARELAAMKNLDIILAAGPWVIEDLIEAGYKGAIVGIYQFDPVITGLVSEDGHPVADNMTLTYSPNKVAMDIRKMNELFSPKKIGFVYFPTGNEFTSMYAQIQRASKDFAEDVYGGNEYGNGRFYSFFKSFNFIRGEIDALYVPPLWGVELQEISEFFRETIRAKIPTFTAEGFIINEKGATAGNNQYFHKPMARFTARKIIDIIKGATPGDLPTKFNEIPTLSLNLESAREIGHTFTRNQIYNAKAIPEIPQSEIPRYSLTQILDQAERENVDLLKIEKLYEAVMAESKNACKTYYPQIDLNAYWITGDDKNYISTYEKDFNRKYLAEINLEQKILSLSSLKSIQIAQKKMQIGEMELDQARADLLKNVLAIYLDLLQAEDRLTLNSQYLDLLIGYYSTAICDLQFGLKDSLDISMLEEQIVSAKIETHRLMAGIKIAQVVLNVIINRPGDQKIILERGEFEDNIMVFLARKFDAYSNNNDLQNKLENYLTDYGINHSLELKKYDLSIGLSNDLITQNKNRLVPDLSLFTKYGYGEELGPSVSNQKGNWLLGLKATLPLFPGKNLTSSGQSLRAELEAKTYDKDKYRFEKYEDIVLKTERIIFLANTLPMEYYSRNLSKDNLKAAGVNYANDKYRIYELIHLYDKTYANELRLLSARYQFFKTYADLLYSIGIGYLHQGSGEQKAFYDQLDSLLGLN